MKKIRVAATIQARMNSKRFPGKVMKKILGKPIIQLQIERLKKSKRIEKIIVATSLNKKDDRLFKFCKKIPGIIIFRGSENDVLERISKLIERYKIVTHVECFGDSPLLDPKIIDQYIEKFRKNNFDCITNTLKNTYPAGQEIMIYKGKKLLQLNKIIKASDQLREHVGYNFTRFKDLFLIKNIIAPKKYNFPNIYMEIDRPIDLIFIKKIFSNFLKEGDIYFSLDQILIFLRQNKNLSKINNKVYRRWKKLKR
mgnify:CR=1 FL=1|tara:strand:+ start:267 stop:1028 length:762 start_codon:yes stop_codon:yes gene_type:complete